MKNTKIEIKVSNGDVSTMLVEGHLEKLRFQLAELKAKSAKEMKGVDKLMGQLDDTLALETQESQTRLSEAFEVLSEAYGEVLTLASTWRQLSKAKVRFTFSHDQLKRGLASNQATFYWLAATFGFKYPTKMDDRASDAHFDGYGVPEGFIRLPWPLVKDERLVGRNQQFVSAKINTPITAATKKLAKSAEKKVRVVVSLGREIASIEEDLKDPSDITRKVTARLTQATLSQAGDLDFMAKILKSVEEPLMLGLSDD